MAHDIDTANLSAEEKHYNQYMTMADNFMKIQIYRQAMEWYNKALSLHLHNDEVKAKMKECKKLLKKESKTIITVLTIIAVIIAVVLIINYL